MTEHEENILKLIVMFGGYVTANILLKYKNITTVRAWQILNALEKDGYLKAQQFLLQGKITNIYQVTSKACKHFNRGDAYMRKRHNILQIKKYLIRSCVLFQIYATGFENIICTPSERKDYLLSRGIKAEHLPNKFNKGVGEIQIEEYMLNSPPYSQENGFTFVVTDSRHKPIKPQIQTVLNRYERIINSFSFSVGFLFVADDENRKKAYEEVYNSYFSHACIEKVRFSCINIEIPFSSLALCNTN